MKSILRITVLLVVALVANYSIVSAAILRVNINAGVAGVYATLDAAYTAAATGDTLLIEGSTTSYGNLTVTNKKLTIFGPGYLLSDNAQTQANLLTVSLGSVTFGTGSTGSLISGCKINNIEINANDITIARNFIQNTTGASPSILLNAANTNIIIQQNFIYGLIKNTDGKAASVVIRNNFVGRIVLNSAISSALIQNNTFEYEYCYYNGGGSMIDVYNSTIINNIIFSYSSYVLLFDGTQNNTITYNILNQATPTTLTPDASNQFSITMPTNVFSGVGTGVIDKNYLVKAGSVAETGGKDGIECGMFGGSFKYVLSGLPPIPHIYSLDADPAGTNTDPLSVKISVKSQN